MPRRRRRQLTLVEWLIVIAIAGILFAVTAPSRSRRGRPARRAVSAPARRPQPAMPVELPDAHRGAASPPAAIRLWRRVQNPLALVLAVHVISRALRRDRRRRPERPRTHDGAPAP